MIVCDDSREFLDYLCGEIELVLANQKTIAKIYRYTEMEEIPASVMSGCDIALLDIDFAGKRYNGIDIARKLRKACRDTVIIFVTNYIEYAPDGYEVNAFRYVMKSEIRKKLSTYLLDALTQLRSGKESLKIQMNGEPIKIQLAEILFMESQQHTVTIHTSKKNYTYYSSLSSLEQELAPKGFLRIHNSYLVNMQHLDRYQSQEAVLSDGTALRVSARSYAEQKRKFLLWKGQQL